MLGVIFAVLSAATFALNNAMARRGVITGTPVQGLAMTMPIGLAGFLLMAAAIGEIGRLMDFPPRAAAWMAGVGVLHFVFGRYCNYRASQAVGVNLSAPVVQLQVIVTLVLAVVALGEPCTVLQAIGGFLILGGSLIAQQQQSSRRQTPSNGASTTPGQAQRVVFTPRHLVGYVSASFAALAYGTASVMARFALEDTGPANGILGGVISYGAATAATALLLLWPSLRRDLASLKRENVRWFAATGIFVGLAQGFFYAAVAVAPIMVVMPVLQLSLVFRLMLSTWLNPDHEVFGWLVLAGVAMAIAGALAVSVDTSIILSFFSIPEPLAHVLRIRVG